MSSIVADVQNGVHFFSQYQVTQYLHRSGPLKTEMERAIAKMLVPADASGMRQVTYRFLSERKYTDNI